MGDRREPIDELKGPSDFSPSPGILPRLCLVVSFGVLFGAPPRPKKTHSLANKRNPKNLEEEQRTTNNRCKAMAGILLW